MTGVAPGATPPYGCNYLANPTPNDNAIEDLINAKSAPLPQRISYALEGWAQPNYFVSSGGSGDVNARAVYQLFSKFSDADPENPAEDDEFAELSYRSSLIGTGNEVSWNGIGPGGDCSAAEAFTVSGHMWNRFNSVYDQLPNGEVARVYDVLVAPASLISGQEVSSNGTTGRWQGFYFGTAENRCYGTGMITTLESTTVTDGKLEVWLDPADLDYDIYVEQLTRPIFGVVLKRWQDMTSVTPDAPWTNEFGWPVQGPVIFNGGAPQASVKGRFYAFGMWFEKGFIWWLDFDNEAALTPTDEAITYRYVGGASVFDADGTYEQFGSNVQYGGAGGTLGATVVIDSYRWGAGDDWSPVGKEGNTYLASINETVSPVCQISMYTVPFGGVPGEDSNGDCAYKQCVWAFRNGVIRLPFGDYDLDQFYAQPVYSEQSIYVVRSMVVDATDDYAFADSFPINIGSASGGGAGEVLIILNDDGEYPTNLAAMTDDMDAMGLSWETVDYSSTVAADFEAGEWLAAVWYRGGPAAGASETMPIDHDWTDEEIDQYRALIDNGGAGTGVLLMSQGHGAPDHVWGQTNAWPQSIFPDGYLYYGFSRTDAWYNTTWDQERMPNAAGIAGDDAIGFTFTAFFPTFPQPVVGAFQGGRFGSEALQAAERNTGSGSSGAIPTGMGSRASEQFNAVGYYGAFFANFTASSSYVPGMNLNPQILGYDLVFLSQGNEAAPDGENLGQYPSYNHVQGPGRLYVVGYGWENTTPTGCTRPDMLQNIMSWLEPGLTFGGGAGGGEGAAGGAWNPYFGDAEILMVKPVIYDGSSGLNEGDIFDDSVYPDPTSSDVLRSQANTWGRPALSGDKPRCGPGL